MGHWGRLPGGRIGPGQEPVRTVEKAFQEKSPVHSLEARAKRQFKGVQVISNVACALKEGLRGQGWSLPCRQWGWERAQRGAVGSTVAQA